jgi:hypothetical protein
MMTTQSGSDGGEPALFFRWIFGSDRLHHAALEADILPDTAQGDRSGYLTVCRQAVTPRVQLTQQLRCCTECVSKLPRNALPRRERRPLVLAGPVPPEPAPRATLGNPALPTGRSR